MPIIDQTYTKGIAMPMLEQVTIDAEQYNRIVLEAMQYKTALIMVKSLIDTAMELKIDAPALAIKSTVDRALEQAE